jgi:hypothetical protein
MYGCANYCEIIQMTVGGWDGGVWGRTMWQMGQGHQGAKMSALAGIGIEYFEYSHEER